MEKILKTELLKIIKNWEELSISIQRHTPVPTSYSKGGNITTAPRYHPATKTYVTNTYLEEYDIRVV